MSDKYKKAYKDAKKELEEKEINEVKDIVKGCLKKLKKLKEEKATLDEKIKYVKLDLEDLKNGRLEIIEERQKTDPKAKNNSVIIVIKEKVVKEVDPWYMPYRVYWNTYPSVTTPPLLYSDNSTAPLNICDNTLTTVNCGAIGGGSNIDSSQSFSICCSVAKKNSIGSYDLNGDGVVNFR